MTVAQTKTYVGRLKDPAAEAELERWAFSQPRQDLEEAEYAAALPMGGANRSVDPDPCDLRRQRDERIELAHEVVEAAWR